MSSTPRRDTMRQRKSLSAPFHGRTALAFLSIIFVYSFSFAACDVSTRSCGVGALALRFLHIPERGGLNSRLRGGKGKGAPEDDEYAGIAAPKRPMSAYMLYAGSLRDSIKTEQPELKMTEISKVIGKRWAAITPEEKAKFEKEAEAEKKKYEKKKLEYEAAVPADVRKERVSKKGKAPEKPKKDPLAPKKPHSAFMIFSISVREELRLAQPTLSFGDLGRLIADKWNSKTPEEKKEYEEKAALLKEKHIVEKARYEAGRAEAGDSGGVEKKEKEKKKGKEKTEGGVEKKEKEKKRGKEGKEQESGKEKKKKAKAKAVSSEEDMDEDEDEDEEDD